MCTTTETIEETQEVVEPRDINVLLSLDTYQGMTDEEIDMVLNYKIQQAKTSQEMLALESTLITRMETELADNQASSDRALGMLQSIIDAEFPTVKNVQPQKFVPSVCEV